MFVIHASRSRYESFMRCMRLGYLQYHWGGLGITINSITVELATGLWLHFGLELIGKWMKDHQKEGVKQVPEMMLGHFIQRMKEKYFKHVFEENKGFNLKEWGDDEWTGQRREFTEHELQLQQQYTFDEQTALVEALLRVFNLRVLPMWMERYKIVAVENDMSFPFVKGEGWEIIQSARIDWVLQEIESKDLYLVSFKSIKGYDNRAAKAASHDTQGLSESWAFDEYLKNKSIDKKIMGVKMLYLIKGQRKETKKGSGVFEQVSPLIRGYRKLGFDGPEYAHSWFFPNSKNDSGIGALGKSWDKMEIWTGLGLSEIGGVKDWIEKLNGHETTHADGGYITSEFEIQPECGDILAQQIVEPEPYLRHERDIVSWERQTKARERDLADRIKEMNYLGNPESELHKLDGQMAMDVLFPQNRQACHYPQDCSYIPICFGTDEEREKPLENGFVWRVPHHKQELIQLQGEK